MLLSGEPEFNENYKKTQLTSSRSDKRGKYNLCEHFICFGEQGVE
tara:strand:- start:288 stop:422 length:135 start_codon:yes stop_codon:yes gene_type:complete